MTRSAPRPLAQRVQDTLDRLSTEVDAWVATADPATGTPYLVPLSFLWDSGTLLLATSGTSPTVRNLRATGAVRLGIGPTRDVVLVEGTVEIVPLEALPAGHADLFAEKSGFDPRRSPSFVFLKVTPSLVQAWRESNEIAGRDLMRDGTWLAAA